MPVLTVHNAQIQTASVEIKTLTISGKQVTLAVFRQLQEAELVAEDGSFVGMPWGVVNYHPDKACGDNGVHLHVVWQQGHDLRRSCVAKPGFRERFWADGGCDEFIQAQYCAASHRLPNGATRHRERRSAVDDFDVYFELDGLLCTANPPTTHHHSEECPEQDLALLSEWLTRDVDLEKQRRGRIRQRWSELLDLPQLFIAV